MSNPTIKFTDLSIATSLNPADVVPIVQYDTTHSVYVNKIISLDGIANFVTTDAVSSQSLFATSASYASYANSSNSASYAGSGPFASPSDILTISASTATVDTIQRTRLDNLTQATNSYVTNSETSSLSVASASFAQNSLTANSSTFASNSLSSSYAQSASFSQVSVTSVTASYAANVIAQNNSFSSSYLTTSSFNASTSSLAVASSISASYAINANTSITASVALNVIPQNNSFTSSLLTTQSYQVDSASIVSQIKSLEIPTSSYVQISQTSSFASGSDVIKLFASSASSAVIDTVQTSQISSLSIATSSYVQNSQTSSFASGSDVIKLFASSASSAVIDTVQTSQISSLSIATSSYVKNSQTSSMTVATASYWSGTFGSGVQAALGVATNSTGGLVTDVSGTTTIYNNLTVPGTLSLSAGIVGTIYIHSSPTAGFPTLGSVGKYEIGYDTTLGIPYIGQGAGNVNLVTTAGIGVPPSVSYSGNSSYNGSNFTISGQPVNVLSSAAGNYVSFTSNALTITPGSVTDASTGTLNAGVGGTFYLLGAAVDASSGIDTAFGGAVYFLGGAAKAASGQNANSGNAYVDAGPITGAGTANYGTVNIGTTNSSRTTIGRSGIQTILNGYGHGSAVMGIMTANTTGTITFNVLSQTETIYNTSSSTIASATITLPINSGFAGQTVRYVTAGAVTSVTMAGGSVVIGAAPTSLVANGSVAWQAATFNTWLRLY
jgi:hypothetical protein